MIKNLTIDLRQELKMEEAKIVLLQAKILEYRYREHHRGPEQLQDIFEKSELLLKEIKELIKSK